MRLPLNIKVALFDLDGVIFNTEDLAHVVFARLSKRYKFVFNEDDHKTVLGSSEAFWSSYMTNKCSSRMKASQFAEEFWKELRYEANKNIKLMHGVLDCFRVLKIKGIEKCLVTSSPREYVKELLNRFEIYSEFVYIVSGEDVQANKPAPDSYLFATEKMNVSPKDCVVIEDSINGVRSGRSAGCYVIAVPTIHASGIDFSVADAVVQGLEEIEL